MFQKLVACIQSPANTLLLRALKEKQVWVLEFGIPGDIQLSWAAPNFARPHSIQPPRPQFPLVLHNIWPKRGSHGIWNNEAVLFILFFAIFQEMGGFCCETVDLCRVAFACLIFPTLCDWFQSAREYQRCGEESRIMERWTSNSNITYFYL